MFVLLLLLVLLWLGLRFVILWFLCFDFVLDDFDLVVMFDCFDFDLVVVLVFVVFLCFGLILWLFVYVLRFDLGVL